jgi:hypothetical protein
MSRQRQIQSRYAIGKNLLYIINKALGGCLVVVRLAVLVEEDGVHHCVCLGIKLSIHPVSFPVWSRRLVNVGSRARGYVPVGVFRFIDGSIDPLISYKIQSVVKATVSYPKWLPSRRKDPSPHSPS